MAYISKLFEMMNVAKNKVLKMNQVPVRSIIAGEKLKFLQRSKDRGTLVPLDEQRKFIIAPFWNYLSALLLLYKE